MSDMDGTVYVHVYVHVPISDIFTMWFVDTHVKCIKQTYQFITMYSVVQI